MNLRRLFHTSLIQSVHLRTSHYSVLGVGPNATPSEIKRAFYRQSMRWHPDRNQGSDTAHQQFLKITEAYGVLSNQQQKRQYDRSLHINYNSNSNSNKPYRYHSSAFSSAGDYTTAHRTPRHSTQRASSYQSRRTGSGQRVRSNFEEWERQHYDALKTKADTIGRYARSEAGGSAVRGSQVMLFQFLEMMGVTVAVVGGSWCGYKIYLFVSA